MDTRIRMDGMEGRVLVGDFHVTTSNQLDDPSWYMAERTVVGCGKGILQPVHLRTGNWEVWIEHSGSGAVRGVRMQSIYADEQQIPHVAMLHADEHTWQIGMQRKPMSMPTTIVEKNGQNGFLVHLLSQESMFGAVINAKRQVEQLHFVADGVQEWVIDAEYVPHFLYADRVIDGFVMCPGFWRVAVSNHGHLILHHEDYPPNSPIKWIAMQTEQVLPLIKDTGLQMHAWSAQSTRLVGTMLNEQQCLSGLVIAPHALM